MTLTPDIAFGPGQPWTPELATLSMNVPVFDDQPEFLGHRQRLTDDELSDTAGQIKDRVAQLADGLKVTEDDGLNVNVGAGLVVLPDGTTQAVPGTSLALADGDTTLIWVDENAAVVQGDIAPAVRLLLASVVTSGGNITTITDLRNLAARRVAPVSRAVRIFGGSNDTDYTATQADILDQGVYYYRNFTVPQGVSIQVDKYARIVCSGNFTCNGRIEVTTAAAGASWRWSKTTDVADGGDTGTGMGTKGDTYPYGIQPHGSGGSLGFALSPSGSSFIRFGEAGRGGGGLAVEAAGIITVGANGRIETPGGPAEYLRETGSGNLAVSGNGGGSGGLILLSSLNSILVSPSGLLDVSGGTGGAAFRNGNSFIVSGGGGGGGGTIVLASPDTDTTSAVLRVAGGSAGAGVGTGTSNLGAGIGGGFGGPGGVDVAGSTGRIIYRGFVPVG